MSIIVDTGVFVAHQNQRDRHHDLGLSALAAAASGRFGRAWTTEYVFDEALTLTRARTRSHAEMMKIANRILGRDGYPRVFDVLMVTGSIFREALGIIESYDDQELSFTDATTIALMQRRGIDRVLSFDDDFDGIVERVDPGDVEGP